MSPVAEIYRAIFREGTPKQRESLEKLADSFAEHGFLEDHEEVSDQCIPNAIRIYEGLGLEKKANMLIKKYKK